jgi:DNA-binding response OmpR family regulator
VRFPQVIVFESDGRLTAAVRSVVKEKGWVLREPRSLAAGLRFLTRARPAALILRVGRDLVRELTILDQTGWLFPESVRFVVTDSDDPALAALAWDLGATYVVPPPFAPQELAEVLAGVLDALDSRNAR